MTLLLPLPSLDSHYKIMSPTRHDEDHPILSLSPHPLACPTSHLPLKKPIDPSPIPTLDENGPLLRTEYLVTAASSTRCDRTPVSIISRAL